ncbi:hypothetical protein LCGC14_1039040 [marine sediment metagenome]|uniref:Fibronectin type-III domain-containing protein n=1 Tax=marine sediment metagenome TaxID=412755 RepID=A0A0F9NDZ3_9ZZZZ
MATDTKTPATGVNESGWTTPNDVLSDNNSCARAVGSGASFDDKNMYATYPTSSIPSSSISLVEIIIQTNRTSEGGSYLDTVYFSKNNGSNYCAGHNFVALVSFACYESVNLTLTCEHTGFGGDITKAEWNSNNIRVRIRHFTSVNTSYLWVDIISIRATYTESTAPAAPADPTISATAVKQMSTSQASPDDGGSVLTDVEVQISTSSTFASGNITWTKGSAPTDPQAHDFTSGDGVTDGTLYYARARYKNAIGWGGYNLTPFNSETSWDVPSTSSDPTLNADGVGDITGTKPSSPANNGSAITYWQYRVDNDSGFGSIDYTSGDIVIGTSTNQATGLANGVVYYAQVRFKNAVGYGSWSVGTVNETTWDVPDAPTWASTKFTARGLTSITFDWVIPANDGGTPITEYWYDWKIDGGSYATIDTNSTNTIATKSTGLVAGTKYWFKVLARNLVGSSPFTSEEFHWTLCATPIAPTVIPEDAQRLTVDWSASSTTGGRTTNAWRIEYSINGSSGWTLLSQPHLNITDIENLIASDNQIRYFRVALYNIDNNISAWSSNGSGTTWVQAGNVTTAVVSTGIEVTKPSDPIDDGTPTFWIVKGRPIGETGPYVDISGDLALGTTTYIDTGVSPATLAYYRCQFKYSTSNYGSDSQTGSGKTSYGLPTQVVGLAVTDQTTTTISIDWTNATDDGSGITDYRIAFDTDNPPTADRLKGNTISDSVETGNAGTFYYIRVRAVNGMGEGSWSGTTSRWTLCIAPTINSIVVSGILLFIISWSTVTGVDVWQLERSPDGSTGWIVVEADIASGTLEKQDFVPSFGDWFYRMTADNADGNPSAYSSPLSGDTLETNLAVRCFEVLEITPNKVTVRVFIESNATQEETYGQTRNAEGESLVFDLTLENGKYGVTAVPHIKTKEEYNIGLASSVYNGGSMNAAVLGLIEAKVADVDGEQDTTLDDIPMVLMLNKVGSLIAGLGSTLGSGHLYSNDDSENAFLSKINIDQIKDDPLNDRYIFSIFAQSFKDATGADLTLFYEIENETSEGTISSNSAYSGGEARRMNNGEKAEIVLPLLNKGSYIAILALLPDQTANTGPIYYRIRRTDLGGVEEHHSYNLNGTINWNMVGNNTVVEYAAVPFYVDDDTKTYEILIQNASANEVDFDYLILLPLVVENIGVSDLYQQA